MEKTRNYLVISLITISLIFIYFNNKKVYLSADDVLGVYVNDELSKNIPSKDEALFQKAICDDENVKVTWDSDNWGLLISNLNKKVKCNLYFYSGQTVFDFDYTGGEQTFTVPFSGTYKLETWGAEGGYSRNNDILGGFGGYSIGFVKINYSDSIYINVGGKGIDGIDASTNRSGGYNGGGNSYYFSHQNCYSGSGGGATHIAFNSGLLSSLENRKEQILIVSGGGGGASGDYTSSAPGTSFGGNGGGFKGTDSYNIVGTMNSGYGFGASQTSGGQFYKTTYTGQEGSFGKGADSTQGTNQGGSGAGGGFYGGGSGGGHFGSGGGSGYIGNSLLTNKVMYCYNCEESSEENTKTISTTCSEETPTSNCSKKGNGYGRITLVSIDE